MAATDMAEQNEATITPAKGQTKTPPFGPFERMVARRYLGATRTGKGFSLISIIAFLGIMVAVFLLIVVMAIMQGFQKELLGQLLGVNGHAFVETETREPLVGYDAILKRLQQTEGVTSAMPVVKSIVYASGASGETGAQVYGLRPEDIRQVELIAGEGHLLEGTLDTFGEGRKGGRQIALGYRLANELGVGIGDGVTLLTGNGANTPFGRTPRSKTYEVGAIFSIGMSEFDSLLIYMPLEQAQLFFSKGDGVTAIEVRVDEPIEMDAYTETLRSVAGPGLITYDWRTIHKSYFNALQTERTMMRLILSLIVLVAILNIVTGLIMLVKDKTSDIAILRTLGATQASIMRIFFLLGALISVLATLTGVVLAALFCWNINVIEKFISFLSGRRVWNEETYFLSQIPAEMQAKEVIYVVVFALVMSFFASIYPAYKAARLDPVEALRYE